MSDKKNGMPQGIRTSMFWVLGVGIISLTLLIMLIIFGNLSGNFGFRQDSSAFSGNTVTLNDTSYNVTDLTGKVDLSLTGIIVTNASGGETLSANNYTITGGNITLAVASEYNGTEVNVSGTLLSDGQAEIDAENLIRNYSASATNTSSQFPIVGTIIGIAILLAVLIGLLVFAIRKLMGVTSAAGGSGGSSSRKFGGSDSAGIA